MSDDRIATWPAAPIDCHVHLFHPALPLADARRYAPGYSAHPANLRTAMAQAGVGMAIVVQPSFLGFDNGYLLRLVAADSRLAGVAVVRSDTTTESLRALRRAGVVGLRLNCIGQAPPRLMNGPDRTLAERAAEAGLVLQIQAEGEQWLSIAPALPRLPGRVVIDHFGRTPPGTSGFEALIDAARESPNLWFKFSGPYRFAPRSAPACAAAILRVAGPARIVWGSDWPWTQFEGRHSYGDAMSWLNEWVPDPGDLDAVLIDNPRRLFAS